MGGIEAIGIETIVSRENVAATYPLGVTNLSDYEKAMQLSRKYSSSEIADMLALNRTRVYQWMEGRPPQEIKESRPFSVKCVEYLEEKKLLPLDYKNKFFREMNILASWLLWSGYNLVSKKTFFSVSLAHSKWNENLTGRIPIIEECLDKIVIPYEQKYNRHGGREIHLIEPGYISRLFFCMGVPSNSNKAEQRIKIFDYISDIMDDKMQPRKETVYDFLKVLFATRASEKKGNSVALNLISNRKRKFASELLYETAKIISKFVPGLLFSCAIEKRNAIDGHIYFTPRINIRKKEIEYLLERCPELFEFTKDNYK